MFAVTCLTGRVGVGAVSPLPVSFLCLFQIRATDQGSPSYSSTARLNIDWIALPPASAEPIVFVEPHINFAVIETDRVAQMVGVILTEPHREKWFDIVGEWNRTHTHTQTHTLRFEL